jgi:signal peptidase II
MRTVGSAGFLSSSHRIDFIDVYYASWHWPTFNVADSAITVGAALLLLDAFSGDKKDVAA